MNASSAIKAVVGFLVLAAASFGAAALLNAAHVAPVLGYWHVWEVSAGLMLLVYGIGAGIVLSPSARD